jgi:hypothetical protein
MDELYLDYNDKNADRIDWLQFEEWLVLILMPLQCFQILGIGEEHHFTLMADLEGKLSSCPLAQALFLKSDLLIMDEPMIGF